MMRILITLLASAASLLSVHALDSDDSCVCPAVFDPVCGSDGMTHSNACAAHCAGIDAVTPGECPSESVGGCQCLGIWEPVCGSDGKTWSNDCYAQCAGITNFTAGVCPDSAPAPGACFCPAVYDPVCGVDGITYGNACMAECADVAYVDGACTGHQCCGSGKKCCAAKCVPEADYADLIAENKCGPRDGKAINLCCP